MTNIGFAGRDGVFTLENAENITICLWQANGG